MKPAQALVHTVLVPSMDGSGPMALMTIPAAREALGQLQELLPGARYL